MTTQQKKAAPKPKIGVYGFTGCAGDEILNLFGSVDMQSFVMASSNPIEGELDVAFVEGSVSTEEEREHIHDIRKRAKILVAMGNCAVGGGPQAMYTGDDKYEKRLQKVYGDDVKFFIEPLEAKPLDAYVDVDYYLPGCPIDQKQAFALITRLIHGAVPEPNLHPVCHECKLNENHCLLLDEKFCLGPLTAGGCDSVCPSHGLPCVGCWGPIEDGNFKQHFKLLESFGMSKKEITRRIKNYGGHKILKYLENL